MMMWSVFRVLASLLTLFALTSHAWESIMGEALSVHCQFSMIKKPNLGYLFTGASSRSRATEVNGLVLLEGLLGSEDNCTTTKTLTGQKATALTTPSTSIGSKAELYDPNIADVFARWRTIRCCFLTSKHHGGFATGIAAVWRRPGTGMRWILVLDETFSTFVGSAVKSRRLQLADAKNRLKFGIYHSLCTNGSTRTGKVPKLPTGHNRTLSI
jgi:hypothetical protein